MNYFIIILHIKSLETLRRLLDSIPKRNDIEIIVVDNSAIPISKKDIFTTRSYLLFYSNPQKGAGAARNLGLSAASGRWIIFADADDYFSTNAFCVFDTYLNNSCDIVFFSAQGIYDDTNQPSDRAYIYNERIKNYIASGKQNDISLRLQFAVPWAKMFNREFIQKNNFIFDEVPASNDKFFSLLTGYYAEQIDACDEIVYIVTTSRGSLTKRRDRTIIESRYRVQLRYNKFLREHDLAHMQSSVMNYLITSIKFGPSVFIRFFIIAITYKQNIFIGYKRWFSTMLNMHYTRGKESRYITKGEL